VAAFTTSDSVPAGVTLPAGLTGPMPPAIANHVAAVVLFGTPNSWFLNLVDQSAPPIAIGQLYGTKTLQLCNPGDPVCYPGGRDRAAHSAYKNNGAADRAADFAANALSSAASAQQTDDPV
jgi:cutinase